MDAALAPRAPLTIFVSKPSGGTRAFTLLHPRDLLRYTRVVSKVTEAVDASLSVAVGSDRLDHPTGRRDALAVSRRRFVERVRDAVRPRGPYLGRTDVRDCFPSIPPPAVERALHACGADRSAILPVRDFLEDLQALGVRGLPVGPACSAVLANAVLAAVDAELEAAGVLHARWVDDVVFAGVSATEVEGLLQRIADVLAHLGLRPAAEKTFVIEQGRMNERSEPSTPEVAWPSEWPRSSVSAPD